MKRLCLILTMTFIVVFLSSCRKEKRRICKLYDSPVGFSIGTIKSSISISLLPKVTYKYNYEVNGISYNEKEKEYGIGQNDPTMIGKQFVVVYELSDPSNSDLNTDFIIKENSDFIEFLNVYTSTNPPPPDFPNNCK